MHRGTAGSYAESMVRARSLEIGVAAGVLAGSACGKDDGPEASGSATSGITTATSGITDDDDDDADGTGEKLDIGPGTDLGPAGDCGDMGGMMGGDPEFSFIWIANSPEGTVSKIDTVTGIEVGRYYTGPGNGSDDPSRTSVNLAGDAAVTNRGGGIARFAAREENCVDGNGNGTIDTSSGAGDVRQFGEDECLLWHIPLPGGGGGNQQGPRPTAWDLGDDGNPCTTDDDRVWVGYFDIASNLGHFYRLQGADGTILDEVDAPNWDLTGGKSYGPYGGATDADGNFWVTGLQGPLVRIDGTTLATQQWEAPPTTAIYGMTLDAEGEPWMAGLNGELSHFDPATQQFEVFPIGANALRGLQIDRDGYAWAAVNGQCGVAQFDTATKTVVNALIPLQGCGTPVGVSIDVEGYVWVPDQGANLAFKLDPNTLTATTTPGLVQPYTYSDMTGSGLGLVVNPPTG